MSPPAIRAERLSKRYRIQHRTLSAYKSLREVITDRIRVLGGGGRSAEGACTSEEFWALRDVSFEIANGEVLGVIGPNGAGKSTLLKILSRITDPTEGRVALAGRVSSLLEVGSGFHPELTGRENIFLNGAVLGMTRREIRRKFDEIVDFAEVERFLDTPVKRYSSGMYVRLAFAVAAHLEPDILVVDEVLAVGDSAFQKKCLRKMKDVSGTQGRTVLFVSHNMLAINRLCSRALLLNAGRVVADGRPEHVTREYLYSGAAQRARREWPDLRDAPGSDVCRLRAVRVTDASGNAVERVDVTSPFALEMTFDVLQPGHPLVPNVHFFNDDGVCLFVAQDHDPAWRRKARPAGRFVCRFLVPGNLLADGTVAIRCAITTMDPFFVHCDVHDAVSIVIEDQGSLVSARGDYTGPLPGMLRPMLQTATEYSSSVPT